MRGEPEADEARRLAEIVGYCFGDPQLLDTALAHPSYAYETDGSRGNERLEFLGDAVLDLVIARRLYEAHPEWSEGELTRARALLVNQSSLAERARAIDLGRFVKLGRTEQRSEGGEKDSILANCFEALVGALYLDGGPAPVTVLVERLFAAELAEGRARPQRDAKTAFQEWAHARFRTTPTYETITDSGTENDEERFTVEVRIGADIWGRGVGRSKRVAERAAAESALQHAEATDG